MGVVEVSGDDRLVPVAESSSFVHEHVECPIAERFCDRCDACHLPALRCADHARIVNVGSGAGSRAATDFGLATNPGSASYAVSKAALHALTAKPAVELAADGILVNAVDPGLTATPPGMEAMGARPIVDGFGGLDSPSSWSPCVRVSR